MSKDWLKELGLQASDDQDGVIRLGCHIFLSYALSTNTPMEESEEFLIAKMLVDECRDCEPAMIASALVRPIVAATPPDMLAEYMSPRVAEIMGGLLSFYKSAENFEEVVQKNDLSVRKIILAMNTYDLEKVSRDFGDLPLGATVEFDDETLPLSELLENMRDSNEVVSQLLIETPPPSERIAV